MVLVINSIENIHNKVFKIYKKTFFKMSDSGTSLIRFTIALRLAQLWKSILFWLITFFVLILEKVFRWTKSLVEMLSHRNTPWITNMWRMKTGLYFRFLTQIVWNRLFFRFLYCRYYICVVLLSFWIYKSEQW